MHMENNDKRPNLSLQSYAINCSSLTCLCTIPTIQQYLLVNVWWFSGRNTWKNRNLGLVTAYIRYWQQFYAKQEKKQADKSTEKCMECISSAGDAEKKPEAITDDGYSKTTQGN
jgi:hypothetical protein